MTRTTNVVAVLIAAVALLAIAAAQTRSQNQQGQTGRYQLLSAQYRWPGGRRSE
jgi:opacity protein-like surface antigen